MVESIIGPYHLDGRSHDFRGTCKRDGSGVEIGVPIEMLAAKYASEKLCLESHFTIGATEHDLWRFIGPLLGGFSHAGRRKRKVDQCREQRSQGISPRTSFPKLALATSGVNRDLAQSRSNSFRFVVLGSTNRLTLRMCSAVCSGMEPAA